MVPSSFPCFPGISEGGLTSWPQQDILDCPPTPNFFLMFRGTLFSFGEEGLRNQSLGTGVSLRLGSGRPKVAVAFGPLLEKQSWKY